MIINAEHDFGFVHIAKCAGSSIRQQLRDYDDLGGRLSRTMQLEGYGRVNGSHLPLHVLAEAFPDDLAALRRVTSYTVCRDPLDRFASGLAQRLRGPLKREPGEMSRAEITAEIDAVIVYLESLDGYPSIDHTFFIPQIDYVELGGEKVVSHVVPIERMGILFNAIEKMHGLPIQRDSVWNPTVTYRDPRLVKPLGRLKKYARKRLPVRQYARLRDAGVRLFTRKGVPQLEDAVKGSSRVEAFVRDYYARDAALHRQALQAAGAAA